MLRKKLTEWMAIVLTVTTVFTQTAIPVNAAEIPVGQATVETEAEQAMPESPVSEIGGVDSGSEPGETEGEDTAAEDPADTDPADIPGIPGSANLNAAATQEETDPPADAAPEADPEDELPYGIKGMPEGYELTATEREIKESVSEQDILGALENLSEGLDYTGDTVICLADDEEHARLIAEAYGGELVEYSYQVATISLADTDLTVEQAVEAGLTSDAALPAVQPNYIFHLEEPVEDVLVVSSQDIERTNAVATETTWSDVVDPAGAYRFNDPALDPAFEKYQWMHEKINTYGAWGVTTGDEDITVAVIDTGVLAGHEELSGKVITASVKTGSTDLGTDPVGSHGTHVAGIIAAKARNGKGGAGVAPGVSILSICVEYNQLNGGPLTGGMPSDAIERAILYAAGYRADGSRESDPRADIINMSLGGPLFREATEAAVRKAYEAGVTLCVAMGNEQANNMAYPAGYDHVIAVASVNESGEKSSFSTWGPWADVAAPGHHIYSPVIDVTEDSDGNVIARNLGTINLYDSFNGTSMATPVVAGACALYMSAVGHVDPDTMERVIKASVSKTPSKEIGTGILDVSKMFSVDTTAPQIDLVAGDTDTVWAKALDGNTVNVTEIIHPGARVFLSRATFDGNGFYQGTNDSGNRRREKLIYTTDGKAPAILNGEVISGTEYSGAFNVAGLLDGSSGKKKITIKAACVTGMGVMGKITTMTFTVDPDLDEYGGILAGSVKIAGNDHIELKAGKSITLKATVLPASASQKVTWRIYGYRDGDLSKAKIGATTGVLTTDPKQTGTLQVQCLSADGNRSALAEIRVVSELSLVSSFKLSSAGETLYYSSDVVNDLLVSAGKNKAEIEIAELKDSAGNDLKGQTAIQWTSSNDRIATVDPTGSDKQKVRVIAAGKGTATITGTALDGSGKKVTARVTVVQDVESIGITGQTHIAKTDKEVKVSYKATVLPVTANNKSVTWSIVGAPLTGVSIDARTGQVTVKKNATCTSFTVRAAAQDGSDQSRIYNVLLTGAKADSVGIETAATETVYQIKRNATTNALTGVRLFTRNIEDAGSLDERWILLRGRVNGAEAESNDLLTWTTSNPKIATVTTNNKGKTATITAAGKGTATITCAAQDGSGRKATVTVKVEDPVEQIKITGPAYVVENKTYSCKAAVLPATVTTKAVKWSIKEGLSMVRINPTSGQLTVNSHYDDAFTVVATATDGSGMKGELRVKIVWLISDSVKMDTDTSADVYRINRNAKGVLTGLRLFSDGVGDHSVDETAISLTGRINDVVVPAEKRPLVWSSSNPKVATVTETENSYGATAEVRAVGKGTATITCAAQDGTGKKATINVKVEVPVATITVTGQSYIAKDASATFKAAQVLPATADNKKVTWSVSPNDGKVTVSPAGVVKVAKDAIAGTSYRVIATATDGSKNAGDIGFTVVEKKATDVKVAVSNAYVSKPYYKIQNNAATGALVSAQLFTANTATGTDDETRLPVSVTVDNGVPVTWTSSNNGIAEVINIRSAGATIHAVKPGTATITCTAADGSNKKTSFKISVIVPASSLTLVPKGDQTRYIGYGKSATLNPVLGQLYGKPGNSKLNWEITKVEVPISKTQARVYTSGLNHYATVSNGKVTVPASSWAYIYGRLVNWYGDSYTIHVKASTTDGSGLTAEYVYDTYLPFTKLAISGSATIPYGIQGRVIDVRATANVRSGGYSVTQTKILPGALTVQSSNPKVISADYLGGGRIRLIARELGTANITITATDGSNTKLTFPASHQKGLVNDITITGPEEIRQGTNISRFTAVVSPDDAKNKEVTWSITDDQGEEITNKKVDIDEKTGTVFVGYSVTPGSVYYVYATAKDAGKYTVKKSFKVVD